MPGLILDGVAGTGKSTLLQHLRTKASTASGPPPVFVMEEDTLGELYQEILAIGRPLTPAEQTGFAQRLHGVVDRVRALAAPQTLVVFERLHLSYFALGIDWPFLQPFDAMLGRFQYRSVLLTIDESELARRCLYRPERADAGWHTAFLLHHGSEAAALAAFAASQRRRQEAVTYSVLPTLVLDTTAANWLALASHIDEWLERT